MIFGIAPGAMGFQARIQASISHRVRVERLLPRDGFPGNTGARLAALFQILFSGTRAACERANVILTVSRATENATSFAVLRPQARAEANRAQARLLAAGWVPGPSEWRVKKTQIRQLLALEFVFFLRSGRPRRFFAAFLAHKKVGRFHSKEKPEFSALMQSKNRSTLTACPVSPKAKWAAQAAQGPKLLCYFLSIRKQGAFSIKKKPRCSAPVFLPHKKVERFPRKEKPQRSAPAKGKNTAGCMPCKKRRPGHAGAALSSAAVTNLPNRTAGYIPPWHCFFPAYSRSSGQDARPRSPRYGIRRWKCGAKAPCAAPRGKTGCTGSWR